MCEKGSLRIFLHFVSLLLLVYANVTAGEPKYKKLETPLAVADFSLSDQYDEQFNRSNLRDRWTLMFLGFTSCPDVCPFTLRNLEAVRAQLSMLMMPENLPQVVFLAVDPARDKAQLRQYMDHFHKEFIGITGDKPEIDKLSKSIDSFYRLEKPVTPGGYYNVTHSSAVLLVNPDAKVVANLSPPFAAQDTANLLLRFIRESKSERSRDLVKIENAWTPPAPPGMSAHAGYLTVTNSSQEALTIVGFESAAYTAINLHLSEMHDGVMSMRELDELIVPANSSLTLEPMSRHLMMFGPVSSANDEGFTVIMKTQHHGTYQFRMEIKNDRVGG